MACALVVDDRVDYSWCPRCREAVDWIEPGVSPWVCRVCDVLVADPPEVPTCRCGRQLRRLDPPSTAAESRLAVTSLATARRICAAVLATAVAVALVDPRNERWVRPLLFAAQIASALWIAWGALQVGSVRDLLRDPRRGSRSPCASTWRSLPTTTNALPAVTRWNIASARARPGGPMARRDHVVAGAREPREPALRRALNRAAHHGLPFLRGGRYFLSIDAMMT